MRFLQALLISLLLALPVRAEPGYPNRPVHFIVPFTPGGNADVIARVIGQGLQEALKQPVVVENRPGANTMIAASYVARAEPDGYTFFLATPESMAINPQLYTEVQYDVFKNFTQAGIVGSFPFALVIDPKLPVQNLADFVAYARHNPGKLNFASWGLGSTSQIAFEQLRQSAGLDMVHVPFPGAAPAVIAVTAGEVQAFMVPLTIAVAQAKNGNVKIITVTSDARQSAAPEIPTIKEQGYPVVISSWHTLAFPKGTPADAVARLNAAMNEALAMPQLRSALTTQGEIPGGGTPEEADRMVKAEWEKWGGIVRAAKLRIDQ